MLSLFKNYFREATQGWMDKQHLVYTYNVIVFSVKKEGNSDLDEPWGCNAKWNKPVTKGQIFHDSTYMRYLQSEKESRRVVTRGWEEQEMGNYCLMGTELQFGKMKSSGDGWWWWLHNVNALNATELYLIMVKIVNWLYIFPTIKNIHIHTHTQH